jgi:hypothetical protein
MPPGRYFKDYMEDYNTATMPHKKYYDLEKWEMAEYAKKQRAAMKNADRRQGFNDEEVQCVRQTPPPRRLSFTCLFAPVRSFFGRHTPEFARARARARVSTRACVTRRASATKLLTRSC